jgi:type IV pilus assembly protein PilW
MTPGVARTRGAGPHRVRGMTLIELMVGIALSLFIAAALGTLVVNMSRAHNELDRASRQIENGRYAIDLLAEEIKVAGYYGEVRQAGAIFTSPDPCSTAIAALGWAANPITVPNALEGRAGTTDVPACVTSHQAATGILTLHRLSIEQVPAASVAGADPYVQLSQCAADPFMPPLVISNDPAAFTLQNRTCSAVNPVRRYLSRIYYVAPCSDCDRDSIPTLKRLELSAGTMQETALAEGIQELQFEYGFDTDSDGVPDQFRVGLDGVAGSSMNEWSNVMAVRIWVLSRSTETTPGYSDTKTYNLGAHGAHGPFNDRFKRRAYTTLVRLNNPAGWRE